MGRDVQPFALVFFRDTQADGQVADLVRDERDDAGPEDRDADGLGLDPQLGDVARVLGLARDPVGHDVRAPEIRRYEYAGQRRTQDAADRVHAEDVQRVVHADHLLQAVHTPQADDAGQKADDECARDADVARCRCDRHESRDRAPSRCPASTACP